jgi:hypothetical protein
MVLLCQVGKVGEARGSSWYVHITTVHILCLTNFHVSIHLSLELINKFNLDQKHLSPDPNHNLI